MSMSTSSMRFPGASNNSDIRKLCTNLIPFPRLHFISTSLAPLMGRGDYKYEKISEVEIIKRLFDGSCFLSNTNLKNGKILTGSVLFKGTDVSECEVDKLMKLLSDRNSSQFVEWIPNRMMSSVCRLPQ